MTIFNVSIKKSTMKEENEFIDFYSGTEVSIIGLRRQLECIGVFGIIQDNFNSRNLAEFYGGTADTVRFKIRTIDVVKARPILEEFLSA
tara:strand:- start:97 stop:363 length:267 start_codon:yes stop_codon:yes gene_type:complete